MSTHEKLKQAAIAAIDAMNADESVSPEEMRDALADVSNHIDDRMRAIDAERDRAEYERENLRHYHPMSRSGGVGVEP